MKTKPHFQDRGQCIPHAIATRLAIVLFGLLCLLPMLVHAQVRPKVSVVGGDDVPQLKKQIEGTLEEVLLEMNRLDKKKGNLDIIKKRFSPEAFQIFNQFVLQNNAYTARKAYSPQMVSREQGKYFDVRSITVKISLGQTEASESQNIVFTFDLQGLIVSVRAVLLNYDYELIIAEGKTPEDSVNRARILDFLERFRMAYNTKDSPFLEKVYSDDALIIVGSVLEEKKSQDNVLKGSLLSDKKVKLIQQTKREYLDGLRNKAFRNNSFINVRFEEVKILQHEKHPQIYGVSCWQQWSSSTYSDKGYLFLMIDFRKPDEPTIHVRTWQPKSFEDGSFVSMYDFDVIAFEQ